MVLKEAKWDSPLPRANVWGLGVIKAAGNEVMVCKYWGGEDFPVKAML